MSTTTVINAGNENLIVLEEGNALTVVGDATANGIGYQLVDGSYVNAEKTYVVGASSTTRIGPFDTIKRIKFVVNVGSVVATEALAASVSPQFSYDASGNVTGLQGPDGLARKLGSRRLTTALVAGDSITGFSEVSLVLTSVTDNGDGTATAVRTSHGLAVGQPVRIWAAPVASTNVMDGIVTAIPDANTFKYSLGGRSHVVTGNTPAVCLPHRRSGRGWFGWMESFLGETFSTTWCAVPGSASADISALLDVTPMTEAADVGFVCIGMNDVYARNLSFANAQVNIKLLIDKVRAKSSSLVVLTIPPKSSADTGGGTPTWTSAKQTTHLQLNRWIYQYGRQVGAVVVDTWRAAQNGATYVNPAASNPDPDTNFLHDFTHPALRGAIAIGKAVADAIAPSIGASGWKAAHPAQIGTSTANLLTGSDFATGSGGVATGWVIDAITGLSVTPTLAARTVATDGDACGFNQVIDIAYGTATGTPSPRFRKNGIQALVTAGQTVQMRIPFSVTGATGLIGLEASLFGSIGSGFWQVYSQNVDGNTKPATGSFSGVLVTPLAVVPAGLTNLDLWIRPTINSAQTGNLTLKVWQPEFVVVS